MKRIIEVDAQGREELMDLVRSTNARIKAIEDEIAERSGELPSCAVRVIALPASEGQIAEAEAEAAQRRGTPPL
jgi:hypothetical protein